MTRPCWEMVDSHEDVTYHSAFSADVDGQPELQELAGNATLLFYMTEGGREGRNAHIEKCKPNFRRFKWLPS